ncbi:MAG: flagellar M-ring protein FliF [Acidobacteria bacterium]|nr:flagellar M-ring protein FliF [Acidobacteriota bacterium]
MQDLFNQIRDVWMALTLRQRASIFISVGMTVAAVAGIVWWARQPSWAVLYTGLDPRDGQAVIQELQSRKVAVRLRDGGTTIEVPFEQVDRLRMELVSKNLPGSGRFGFLEMFAQDNIAQSNQAQRIRYQKALEDELARTIESLDEIRTARVHLVLPGERVFVDDDDVAKASVTLGLAPGGPPSSEQVQAIARIVAGAVPELSVERVSVLDTNGRVLWEGDGEGGGVTAARQVELKSTIEKDINAKVARVLEPVVGADRFVVRTSADVDFQKERRREKEYDPDTGVLMSETKSKEKSVSGGKLAAGVPGTASNLPGGAGGSSTGADGETSDRTEQQASYEYSVVERDIEEPVGSLKRLSVAVIVDQAWEQAPAGQGGTPGERRAVPRSDDEMSKLEDLVRAAISFDQARGDVVTVEQAPFQQPAVTEEPARPFDYRAVLPFVKYPALVVLALLVFVLFFRPVLKTVREAADRGPGIPFRAGSASIEGALALGSASSLEKMRQRLAALATDQPEGMAQTVRLWLNEPKEKS